MTVLHYELTPQERTQIDGRWHGERAPLCATGDGHYRGFNPSDWSRSPGVTGNLAKINCPRCCERKHLVAQRERAAVDWEN